jgi:hypothetical protein
LSNVQFQCPPATAEDFSCLVGCKSSIIPLAYTQLGNSLEDENLCLLK